MFKSLRMYTNNLTFLRFALLAHFDTFPGVCVGWKIEVNVHLSQAELRLNLRQTELGNTKCTNRVKRWYTSQLNTYYVLKHSAKLERDVIVLLHW